MELPRYCIFASEIAAFIGVNPRVWQSSFEFGCHGGEVAVRHTVAAAYLISDENAYSCPSGDVRFCLIDGASYHSFPVTMQTLFVQIEYGVVQVQQYSVVEHICERFVLAVVETSSLDVDDSSQLVSGAAVHRHDAHVRVGLVHREACH